jgi:transposase
MKAKKSKKVPTGKATRTSARKRSKRRALKIVHPRAAGIDVGSREHHVAVPPDSVPEGEPNVRVFGTYSEGLDALVEWLKACRVDTVALESTGVYWLPLVQKLEEAGLEAVLANARQLKNVPGRKTDVKDCQWIQQLHSFGLLSASFRPDEPIARLRTLVRHRATAVSGGAGHILHMQKALTQMNVQVHHVVSHLTGETGLRLVRAIVAGERDPDKLLELRDAQITKSTVEEMRRALVGDWRTELLFVLKQSLEGWDFCQKQMKECDVQIEQQLASMSSAPKPAAPPAEAQKKDPLAAAHPKAKAKQSRKRNDPEKDLAPELARICGVDLMQAHGFRILSILVVLSEIGIDMSHWRNDKAFCSWLGLCPNNKISGGRILSTGTRPVANRAAQALRQAAVSLAETNTWIGSFHRRKRARLGPAGAVTATAHKLAIVVYHLLKNKEAFHDRDLTAYEERVSRERLQRLRKTAARMGFELVPKNPPTNVPEEQTVTE